MREQDYPPLSRSRSVEIEGHSEIVESINPELKVAYVVPIQDEIDNGNIFDQLKDFVHQDASTSKYEVIYVVNNTQADKQSATVAFTQNQKLLALLSFASGRNNELPDGVNEWQASILHQVRDKGVKIVVVDKSNDGLDKREIESARIIGENLAIERFKLTDVNSNGAIVLMDADTRIARNSTDQIIAQLVSKPEVGMLRVLYDERPGEGGTKLYQSTSQKRLRHTIDFLYQAIKGPRQEGWYVIKAGALGTRDPRHVSAFDRDSVRPAFGTIQIATDLSPFTQDRARPGTVGGQFGANRFSSLESGDQGPEKIENPVMGFLSTIYAKLKEKGRLSEDVKVNIFNIFRDLVPDEKLERYLSVLQYDRYALYSDEVATEVSKRNEIAYGDYGITMYKLISRLCADGEKTELDHKVSLSIKKERIRHSYTSRAVDMLIDRSLAISRDEKLAIEPLVKGKGGSRLASFLLHNDWILDLLNDLRNKHNNKSSMRKELEQLFPELLLPFEETAYTKSNAILLGVVEFLKFARAHSQNFSHLMQYLGE